MGEVKYRLKARDQSSIVQGARSAKCVRIWLRVGEILLTNYNNYINTIRFPTHVSQRQVLTRQLPIWHNFCSRKCLEKLLNDWYVDLWGGIWGTLIGDNNMLLVVQRVFHGYRKSDSEHAEYENEAKIYRQIAWAYKLVWRVIVWTLNKEWNDSKTFGLRQENNTSFKDISFSHQKKRYIVLNH